MKEVRNIILIAALLVNSPLFSQSDSALSEISKIRETLSKYKSEASPIASDEYVSLKKTTYDSLISLLYKQQHQIDQLHKDFETIRLRLKTAVNPDMSSSAGEATPVYFELGSTNVTGEGLAAIQHLVETNGLSAVYSVNGFTDGTGANQVNEKLSMRRAVAVKNFMVTTLKLKPENVDVKYFGSGKKVCESYSPPCNKQNRRVEIRVKN